MADKIHMPTRADGYDTYPELDRLGTREQKLQAQAENLRAEKGIIPDGNLAPISEKDFGEVDTEGAQENAAFVRPDKRVGEEHLAAHEGADAEKVRSGETEDVKKGSAVTGEKPTEGTSNKK
jgi:hypothetical protein